jgi:hypothetical protein
MLLAAYVAASFLPRSHAAVRVAARIQQAASITRHDITWTFDKAYPTGTFVNGDPWVLGPLTIVAVTPGWDGEVNGTQVDPPAAKEQGFRTECVFGPPFNEALRARFPLTLQGVHSVVSTIGMKPQKHGGAYDAFETASVLTVVDRIPAAGSFRPPYVNGPKPIFTVRQIHWDRLPTLAAPEGFVPPEKNPMERLWMDHAAMRGPANGPMHPRRNMDPYYFYLDLSRMAVVLLLDYPARKAHLYSYMQYGIDCYYISLQNDDAWRAYGGFGNGRKWPILFTGILLDNQAMMHPPKTCKTIQARTDTVDKFGEDGHTYYGKPTDAYPHGKPLWGQDGPPGRWFGNHDLRDPDGRLDPEQLPQGGEYRTVCSRGWVGAALAARLMGAMNLWDHPAYFDYVDRWVQEEAPKGNDDYTYGPDPIKSMWLKYCAQADAIGGRKAHDLKDARH